MKPKTVCDYCGEAPNDDKGAMGFVANYGAWVHEECYEDHHG